MPTSAIDAVEILLSALSDGAQQFAYERTTEIRVQRIAGTETTAARLPGR